MEYNIKQNQEKKNIKHRTDWGKQKANSKVIALNANI